MNQPKEVQQGNAFGSPRLRILFVISSLNVGGPQRSLVGLLQRLDFGCFDVCVGVLDGREGPLAAWLPSEVELILVPPEVSAATFARGRMLQKLLCLARILRPLTLIKLFGVLARGAANLRGRQVMRQRAWTVVQRELPRLPGAYDAAFGILGLSTMCIVDLVDAKFKFHWIRSDTRVLNREVKIDGGYFSQLTGAVAVSESCSQIFEEIYPSFADRIVVYKNDIPQLTDARSPLPTVPRDGMTLVLTVSRLDRLKGIDLAIDACAHLVATGHKVFWVVVGDGAERERLERMIGDRGLRDSFILWGETHNVPAFLEMANIYVHPSRTEGRSNSVEEARAFGLPIVATAYETVGDQIQDGKTGLICDISADGIADAVARIIGEPEFSKTLGRNAAAAHASEVDDPNALLKMLATGAVSMAVRGNRE